MKLFPGQAASTTTTEPPYRVEILPEAADLPAAWDALLTPEEALHTCLFNRTVAEARVEAARIDFVVLYNADRLICTATLSAFDIDLGLFLGKNAGTWLLRIRRLAPRFLKIRILVCGLPASFGQANLAFASGADRVACVQKIAAKMEMLARERKINYLCFKEFPNPEPLLSALGSGGGAYFQAHSLPDTRLNLSRWSGFEAYLAAMRAPYRRKIRLSLRKIGLTRPDIHPYTAEKASGSAPALLFGHGAEVCPPEVFHRLYDCVMARAETKLETLNRAFFEKLYDNYAGRLVVLALWQGGVVQGAVLLLPAGRTLLWLLVGIEQARDPRFDTYFNLAQGMIEYAFRFGFQQIKTGQTAYPFKRRLGAEPEDLFLFFRAKNRLKHFFLKKLRGVIFPRTVFSSLQVFK